MNEIQIRNHLLSLQDKGYKDFHSSLCPGTDNIIGIRIPVLRNYAKQLSNQPYSAEYVFFKNTKYYEEIMLQGMLIGLDKKSEVKDFLKMIENFIPKIDNWAVCDVFCGGLKKTNKHKEIFWVFINKYLRSKKEFELRFAVVMLLGYYLTDEYICRVLKILDGIKHDGYYIKMAVAWTLSTAFVKHNKQTMTYLKSNNNLDDWTYNKALQKITESFRVDKKTKEIVRNMKR